MAQNTVSMEVSPEPYRYDAKDLKKLLDAVNPAGSFATTGTFSPSLLSPKVLVKDFGTVGLPLHPFLANELKKQATKAPFGRGPATIVDECVRRTWQIEPDRVCISGEKWEETMEGVFKKATYELGISNENVETLGIVPKLYKILLYEEGGFFKPHKDTVKEEGMFGTLVVQLPCEFSGCASTISHQGETKRFEMAPDSESTFRYVAFYADCEHEILPLEKGWRFCLVYNLVVTKPNDAGIVPDANQMRRTWEELEIEVAKWLPSSTGKLGYALDHQYTLDSIGFGSLKGRDAVVMSALRNAVDATGARLFDLSLAMFYRESYSSDHFHAERDEEYWVEKVILEDDSCSGDRNEPLIRESKKQKTTMAESPVWVEDILYRDADGFLKEYDDIMESVRLEIEEEKEFDDCELDIGVQHEIRVEHHEQTGNEGGGSTTWYGAACLVFRPASKDVTSTVASLCSSSSSGC